MKLKLLALLLPLALLPVSASCACGAPQPPQQTRPASTTIAVAPEPLIIASSEPAASASGEPEPESTASAEPEPPPPPEMAGNAAIVWVKEEKAAGGFRSVWIEQDGAGAKVVAEREEAVFVSGRGLYGIGQKTFKTLVCDECDLCAFDPPQCKKNRKVELPELFLRGLGKQPAVEPWNGVFASWNGCKDQVMEHLVSADIIGGVGPVVFAGVGRYAMTCLGAHGGRFTFAVAWDLDTGVAARITPHPEHVESLKHKAHEEIKKSGCMLNVNEQPTLYRITARYRSDGRLEAVYTFTTSAGYMCGSGPATYTAASEQASLWLPAELTRFGRVPAWVASFLKKRQAQTAFMVTSKVDEARAQFTKK